MGGERRLWVNGSTKGTQGDDVVRVRVGEGPERPLESIGEGCISGLVFSGYSPQLGSASIYTYLWAGVPSSWCACPGNIKSSPKIRLLPHQLVMVALERCYAFVLEIDVST